MLTAAPAFADETPPPALAPSPAVSDAVHLRNGGLYRGRVTEIVPNDHVTIIVERGEPTRIAWGEIAKVVVATASAPITPTPATAPIGAYTIPSSTPPLPAPMNGPKVRVRIDSPTSVVLYRRPAGSNAWTLACTSPCNEMLPLGDAYRVSGNDIWQSSEFSLQGAPGSTVEVHVDGQSTGGMFLGGTLTAVGGLVAYGGFLAVLVSLDNRTHADDDEKAASWAAFGIGMVATVAGILIFLASAKTDITQNPVAAPTVVKDAFQRLPTWRTVERGPATAQFPVLFSHAF